MITSNLLSDSYHATVAGNILLRNHYNYRACRVTKGISAILVVACLLLINMQGMYILDCMFNINYDARLHLLLFYYQ